MKKKVVAKAVSKKVAGAKNKSLPPTQNDLDGMLRQFASLVMGQGVSEDDLKALVTSLDAPSAHDGLSDAEADAKNEAQQIAFDAMEATSATAARKLAKRALKLDPDCVDALVVLNDLDARTPKDLIVGLQKAVAAGKRSLGEQFFVENKGHFWMLIETRPYMRAMEMLASQLTAAGVNLDAIALYEEMLELNPNDNQGVRDPLLGLYLAVGDGAGAKRLLQRFKGDGSACFAWGRLLERLLARDYKRAEAALKKAIESNRHVALQLTGRSPMPDDLPEMYSLGSEEEATLCLNWLGNAWLANQEAFVWLLGRCAELGMTPVPSKAALKKMKTPDARVQ